MISTHFRIIDYHDLLFKSSMNVYFVDFVGEERVYPVHPVCPVCPVGPLRGDKQ